MPYRYRQGCWMRNLRYPTSSHFSPLYYTHFSSARPCRRPTATSSQHGYGARRPCHDDDCTVVCQTGNPCPLRAPPSFPEGLETSGPQLGAAEKPPAAFKVQTPDPPDGFLCQPLRSTRFSDHRTRKTGIHRRREFRAVL